MKPSDTIPDPGEEDDAPRYYPALSRNQKKRSKLQQVPDESSVEETEPEPTPDPVPPPPSVAQVRRTRLKRSGHMHDDLTQPLPEEGAKRRASDY